MLKVQLERYLKLVCGDDYKPSQNAQELAQQAKDSGSVFPVELFYAWLTLDREAQTVLSSLGVSWNQPTTNPEANVPMMGRSQGEPSPWEAHGNVLVGNLDLTAIGPVEVYENNDETTKCLIVQAVAGMITVIPVEHKPSFGSVTIIRPDRIVEPDRERVLAVLDTLPQWRAEIEFEEDVKEHFPLGE